MKDPKSKDREFSIVLYDGVCGLCDKFVRFVIRRDQADRFRLASLQSEVAASFLRRHGVDPSNLSTVILVLRPGTPAETLLVKSRAALTIVAGLGGVWRWTATGMGWLPTLWLDAGYDVVARSRYRWFGRREACAVPTAKDRAKFLD